jgi:hypothetical protein
MNISLASFSRIFFSRESRCIPHENYAQSTYICIKSTTVYVPSSELGLSQPLSRQRVCPSPPNRGVGHTRLRVRGWGSPNSDDRRKSFALCLLCGSVYVAQARSTLLCAHATVLLTLFKPSDRKIRPPGRKKFGRFRNI